MWTSGARLGYVSPFLDSKAIYKPSLGKLSETLRIKKMN
jgi:hypothetical protein